MCVGHWCSEALETQDELQIVERDAASAAVVVVAGDDDDDDDDVCVSCKPLCV